MRTEGKVHRGEGSEGGERGKERLARAVPCLRALLCLLCLLGVGALPVAANEDPDATPPAESESQAAKESQIPRALRSTGDDSATLAPIGLPDARSLSKNEWAVSYRYSLIHFDDMRSNRHRNSTNDVLQRFDETPRDRDLQVHLFGLSYAPHRRVTLSARLPVLTQKTHVVSGGPPRENFHTTSKGIGDLELRVLVPFMRKRRESLQVEFGLTAPTGSISERDVGAGGDRDRLSFQQQLGSGTVDLLTGAVYRGRWETLSWGVLARSKFRFYENSKNYRLGHEHLLSAWLAQSWTDWMSTSLRMSWQRRQNVHPADRSTENPELDPKRQAGESIDLGPGVNFRIPFLGDPRFGVEMSWPFFQTLDGPQLERDWQLTAGWEWAF
jgi:hypothetical protein